MVLKLEKFNLIYITHQKTIMKILKLLILKPNIYWGLTELSLELLISKSTILRIMHYLTNYNLVLEQKSGHKVYYQMAPNFRNPIDFLSLKLEDNVSICNLFGSIAFRGLLKIL
jgi:predicted DNA-binding transcriptional regulator YafY